uniref:ShKT domain-containing protein n=1 Tax=Caenorhabditis tropicalis TaxID=1561998 RepID=A0A1I7T6Q5_9PELO
MSGLTVLLALSMASGAMAAITEDFSCTDMTSYTATATACANTIADQSCQSLYKESATGVGYPAAGNQVQRPFLCYSTSANGGSVSTDMKKAAIQSCPKTCGMCCLTTAYNCTNAQFPNINCATILPSQCSSPIWREKIAQNCPSVCGFCNDGGCVDGVTDCANDITICTNINMQPFVNEYCKKTCGRCTANPSNPTVPVTPSCTRYPADTSTSCAAWANNGFCKNDFYKEVWRTYCATTCKIC